MNIPRGVCIDIPRARALQDFAHDAQRQVKARLTELGLQGLDPDDSRQAPPRKEMEDYFLARGLLADFPLTDAGNYSFAREVLERFEDADPAVRLLLILKRLLQIVDDPFYGGRLCTSSGRVLFDINPLGANTGRPTSSRPNLIGLGKIFRPLVIGDTYLGLGLVELDMEQQEPLICALLAGDMRMVDAYAAGDIYAGMAKQLFRHDLSAEDLALSTREFKKRHKGLRDICKTLTLGIMYGMGERSLSLKTGRGIHSVRRILQEFADTYPRIHVWREMQPILLQQRGFAYTVSGLRRYRNRTGPLEPWERRWATNLPVQGSAADILKKTLLITQPKLMAMGARIVLPIYDALLVEAPLDRLQEAAQIAHDGFIAGFRHYFPGACPRIDVNDLHPGYWNKISNKDRPGQDSLDRFFADPLQSFEEKT